MSNTSSLLFGKICDVLKKKPSRPSEVLKDCLRASVTTDQLEDAAMATPFKALAKRAMFPQASRSRVPSGIIAMPSSYISGIAIPQLLLTPQMRAGLRSFKPFANIPADSGAITVAATDKPTKESGTL
jgi:hypothetical protein